MLSTVHFSFKYQINGFIFKVLRHYILRPLKILAILKAAQHRALENPVVILGAETLRDQSLCNSENRGLDRQYT